MDVTIGGKIYELEVSVDAAKRMNAICGGMLQILPRLRSLDFNTMTELVIAGAGVKGFLVLQHQRDAIWNAIWAADNQPEILAGLIEYAVTLIRGGRPPEPDEPD